MVDGIHARALPPTTRTPSEQLKCNACPEQLQFGVEAVPRSVPMHVFNVFEVHYSGESSQFYERRQLDGSFHIAQIPLAFVTCVIASWVCYLMPAAGPCAQWASRRPGSKCAVFETQFLHKSEEPYCGPVRRHQKKSNAQMMTSFVKCTGQLDLRHGFSRRTSLV